MTPGPLKGLLVDIISKALEKDRKLRYQSAADMREARALARVNSPRVCQVFDVLEHADQISSANL